MRAAWFCVILFLALLLCIGLNAHYIRKQASFLTQTAELLQEEENRPTALAELEAFWQKHRNWIGLSVGFREMDHFGEVLTNLRWAYDTGDEQEFRRYRLLFLDAIEEISRTERFSVRNLF